MKRTAGSIALLACLAGARGIAHGEDTPPQPPPSESAAPAPPDTPPPPSTNAWCAPELQALPNDVCAFAPKLAATPRTLVIFLHGVIQPDTGWQWSYQRAAVRAATAHGFTAIMPRGRRGIGPKGMEDWWTWPTKTSAQTQIEGALLSEWATARAVLEERNGVGFERVWIFGFSNGAYYATSLALRDRIAADGYAVFAGGSGAAYLKRAGARAKHRAPIYVGWGNKDPAHRDPESLARLLRDLAWPYRSRGTPGAGHLMADAQVSEAVSFLGGSKR